MWEKNGVFIAKGNPPENVDDANRCCEYTTHSRTPIFKGLSLFGYPDGTYLIVVVAQSRLHYNELKEVIITAGFPGPGLRDIAKKIYCLPCNDLSVVAAFLKTIKAIEPSFSVIEQDVCNTLHIDLSQEAVIPSWFKFGDFHSIITGEPFDRCVRYANSILSISLLRFSDGNYRVYVQAITSEKYEQLIGVVTAAKFPLPELSFRDSYLYFFNFDAKNHSGFARLLSAIAKLCDVSQIASELANLDLAAEHYPKNNGRTAAMLTRDQLTTLMMLRKRPGNVFSSLPVDVLREIGQFGQNHNSEINEALAHAADARKKYVEALLAMLDKNPRLLLQAGNVRTPGGYEVRGVTIYEFVLGAGDSELAKLIAPYFAKIKTTDQNGNPVDGEAERVRQYERYRPHIENMLTEKPDDDIEELIAIIKKASAEDIIAALNKNTKYQSELNDALNAFRKKRAPRIISKPCMHFKYANVQYELDLLERVWKSLLRPGTDSFGYNYDKHDLIWRQIIGFEFRRLPGIDRCAVAQGELCDEEEPINRSYHFRNGTGQFPYILADHSLDGLGRDVGIDIERGKLEAGAALELCPYIWRSFVERKRQDLRIEATPSVTASMRNNV